MLKNSLLYLMILLSSYAVSQEKWLQVETGTEYSLGLREDSTLWSWGVNGNGQLGNNLASTSSNSPIIIAPTVKWRFIATGAFHAFAIRNDGTLWAWGLNGNGQLGTGDNIQKNKPTQIGTDTDWVYVDGGQAHTHAIKSNGTLWGWGLNFYGGVGTGNSTDYNVPTQIGTDTDWKMVSDGGLHTIATKTNGTIWSTGLNGNGQLGIGTTTNDSVFKQIGTDNNWDEVHAGFEFSVGIKTNGKIFTWGFNGNGQLGDSTTTQQLSPKDISGGNTWIKVCAGSGFGHAIRNDSTLWSWGYNQFGQLGDGSNIQRLFPILADSNEKWIAISAADGALAGVSLFGHHSLGLRASREGICFSGANYTGQGGNGTVINNLFFDCTQITTSTDEIFAEESISIFPNPTNGLFTIEIENIENSEYVIMNMAGQIVKKGSMQSATQIIDIYDFSKGVYLLRVSSNGELVTDKKIIKY